MYAFSCDTQWCNNHSTTCHVKPHLNWCNGITRGIPYLESGDAEASSSGCMKWISVQPSRVAFCTHTQDPVKNFKAALLEWLYKPLVYLTY